MIAIIDYGAGNLTSVARAVQHLGFPCAVTRDPGLIRAAERIIFPGVGAAGAAMRSLGRAGLDTVLAERFAAGVPILGICIGCQVVLETSAENATRCLGLIAGEVRGFPQDLRDPAGRPLKVPHMGWNRLSPKRPHPLLGGLDPADEFYFVHGFYPIPAEEDDVVAITDYGLTFASVISRRNLAATQFHLEKSGRPGLRILNNFCRWEPALKESGRC